MSSRAAIHIGLHFFVPFVIAIGFYKREWFQHFAIMMLAMLIDLDHLLADPIFDPNRNSIGFHHLHSYPAILVYVLLLIPKKTRVLGIGLVVHIVLDLIDGILMRS